MIIIGARIRFLTVRQSAAIAVAVLAVGAVVSGLALEDRLRPPLVDQLVQPALRIVVGLGLLMLTPRLWRGTRTAVSLAVAGLLALVALSAVRGHYGEMMLDASLAALLVLGRSEFTVGCRNRPRLAVVGAALGAWALAYFALRIAPLVPAHPLTSHAFARAIHVSASAPSLSENWTWAVEALVLCAALTSVLAMRSLLRPAAGTDGNVEPEYGAAREIVERYGEDSLSPFVLRPDKALHFGAGGVLSYRVIRGTAIVSSDPVAPGDAAPEVLASFREVARRRGWQVALWGASSRHLSAYHELGLRSLCVGEEAFVDPRQFTLEGRPVRKLRQSVHRVARRGWEISVHQGRFIDASLEQEIDELEKAWRDGRQLLGFAMAMGPFPSEVRPDDLYVVARAPEGDLGAAMRFVGHCGKLSLDTMHRVGETPNGLNEALVCRALEAARERGVQDLSLNYAGLAHLMRREPSRKRSTRVAARLLMVTLGRRFQMERLVRFNDKFGPEWRPRYLIYESRAALPRTVLRVLQAEGYIPEPHRPRRPRGWLSSPRALVRSPRARNAG